MEIIISYAFAHIIEAIILWMSMSQMYEHRYKQWVTGFVLGGYLHSNYGSFRTNDILCITIHNEN